MKKLELCGMTRFAVCILVLLVLAAMPLPSRGASADDGWRCWPDTQAAWQNDTLYLPGDAPLSALPTNAPTGGWTALTTHQGIPVVLPSTIEEHLAQFFPPGAQPLQMVRGLMISRVVMPFTKVFPGGGGHSTRPC